MADGGDAYEQDRKLIATQPGDDGIAVNRQRQQTAADFDQTFIARAVAILVIHVLEQIEIKIGNCNIALLRIGVPFHSCWKNARLGSR